MLPHELLQVRGGCGCAWEARCQGLVIHIQPICPAVALCYPRPPPCSLAEHVFLPCNGAHA